MRCMGAEGHNARDSEPSAQALQSLIAIRFSRASAHATARVLNAPC